MKIRPLQGECLVYMEDSPDKSEGGIDLIAEDQEQESPREVVYGQVRRLGLWKQGSTGKLIPYDVKLGDRVALNSGSGRWLKSYRERMKIVKVDSILAVVEK